MFFFLSKTISFLITPLAWILISVTFAFMTNKTGRRKKRNLVAFFLLLLFTNPWLANKAIESWEVPAKTVHNEHYDVVVVLSGMTNPNLRRGEQVQFNGAAERFIEPLRLYHQDKVDKILLSGGSGNLIYQDLKETPELRRLAIQLKVADENLIVEAASRNTHENAKFTAEILNEKYDQVSVLLITSASHMKRAAACFKKQGITVDLYPVDFRGNPDHRSFLKEATPNIVALETWTILFHELFGYVTYWIMGYL